MIRTIIQEIKQQKQLRALALKLYSIKYPFPYERPNMEFEYDPWNSVSTLRCWNGRQIGEDNAGPYPYGQNSDNAYETCRFKDSREGLLMNITNLRIVLPAWNDAQQLTITLRNKYIESKNFNDEHFNLIQAYLFSKMAISLPAYLIRRKDNAIYNGTLQPVETAFYMLGTAPFMMVRQLMVRGDKTPLNTQTLTGEQFYKMADKCGVLISTRQCACPASPNLIQDYFQVFMNGDLKKQNNSLEVQRVLKLIGSWINFFDYTTSASRLELLIKLNQALIARILFCFTVTHESYLSQNDTAHELINNTLRNLLKLSYIRAENSNVLIILNNTIEILLVLLDDHDLHDVYEELNSMGYLNLDFQHNICDMEDAVQCIRSICRVVYYASIRNQLIIHRTLGYSDYKQVTELDFLVRIGGNNLSELLGSKISRGVTESRTSYFIN